jgi:putative ABC transport system permease protein
MAIFGSTGPSRVDAVPLRAALAGGIQPIILLVFGAAALMLSIATMNVAGVQLARTAARRRELAIRSAIGASRGRIARQVVLENIVVGCLGGAFGLAIAVVLHAALLPRVATIGGARIDEPAFDWPVLLFGFALTLIVSALCAVVPAVMANRVSVTRALTEDGQAPVGGALRIKTTRVRAAMMTGQVAIAAVLLSGALLVTRSFINAVAVDRGYQPHGLLTARLPLPTAEFPRVKRASTLDEIIARLEQSPGVTHAAATDILPLIDLEFPRSFEMPSRQAGAGVVTVKAMSRSVTRDYFATMGMRVVEGRGFGEGDTLTSLPVALVNRTFARRYLDERQSLGALIPIKFSAGKVNWQVVGVVDDVRNLRAGDPPQPEIFGCSCQMTGGMLTDFPAVVVRTSGDPTAFAPSLRTVVQQIAPTVSLDSVMTMDDRLSASVAGPRLSMTLLVSFAGFALLVAGVGLFAMLSQSVALRARELSIRTALGARTSDVLQLVLRQALGITVLGIAAGLPVSILVGRYFRGFLFGVTPDDPVTLVVVPGTLLVVGIAATLAPALRAVRLDPAAVLKT